MDRLSRSRCHLNRLNVTVLLFAALFLAHISLGDGSVSNSRGTAPSKSPTSASEGAVERQVEAEDNIFAHNQAINFTWDDPILLAALGIQQNSPDSQHGPLSKRAPNPIKETFGPIFRAGHCLGCKDRLKGRGKTLQDLTLDFIHQQSLFYGLEEQLTHKCIFYTGVTEADKAKPENAWVLMEPDQRLSAAATRIACRNDKETIWTLWPGKSAETLPDKPADRDKRNMYEVYVDGSWLSPLRKNTEQFEYFGRMSEVMATMCQGDIIVLTLSPENIHLYGGGPGEDNAHSIWNKIERPTLSRMSRQKSLAVYVANIREPWHGWRMRDLDSGVIDVNEPRVSLGITRDSSPLNPLKTKRSACGENVEYETGTGADWFGAGIG